MREDRCYFGLFPARFGRKSIGFNRIWVKKQAICPINARNAGKNEKSRDQQKSPDINAGAGGHSRTIFFIMDRTYSGSGRQLGSRYFAMITSSWVWFSLSYTIWFMSSWLKRFLKDAHSV